ncbi:hypothetical protein NXT3_PB00275 (plasmid) [Sinorhizobium fredii]|uniref:Uncharacterized protein n=1 Tax=Rhizobium fredii TaxID=380 RepID=A0A2L0HBR9_RHIFR|nr:hypothetical protein NXT3_PB00275 [Sinorhizobium fredii]
MPCCRYRYTGSNHNIPRYSCWRGLLDNGEPRCITFGGLRVDDAIEAALLRDLEAARYAADRALLQYDAADPEDGLVTSELEARSNNALAHVGEIEARVARHQTAGAAINSHVHIADRRACGKPSQRMDSAIDRCKAGDTHRAHAHP